MKNSIKINNANLEKLDKVVELENKIWPEGTRAPKEKFVSRLEIFPEGFFSAYKNNEICLSSFNLETQKY